MYAKLVGKNDTHVVSGAVGIDKEADLALLKLEGVRARALRLANSNEADIGDVIYVVGNPEGLEGTLSQGIVSALRGEYIQISAPISHGSSGSPVLNADGNVIGVARGTIEEGQNLNFAIPSSKLISLMQNVTALKPFPISTPNQSSANELVSGEWTGTTTLYAIWNWNREDWSGGYAASMARPRPFSLKLRLESQTVTGSITFLDSKWTSAITGTAAGSSVTLRFFTESTDGRSQGTTSRLDLQIEEDRMSG